MVAVSMVDWKSCFAIKCGERVLERDRSLPGTSGRGSPAQRRSSMEACHWELPVFPSATRQSTLFPTPAGLVSDIYRHLHNDLFGNITKFIKKAGAAARILLVGEGEGAYSRAQQLTADTCRAKPSSSTSSPLPSKNQALGRGCGCGGRPLVATAAQATSEKRSLHYTLLRNQ